MEISNESAAPPCEERVGLWRIVQAFFCIGLASFSLAALGEAKDRLTKRRWFTEEEYLQGVGLAQVMPGAPTVNLFSYLGFRLRGLSGAAAATISFLVPSFLLMLLLSHFYFQYGESPVVSRLFRGLGALVAGLVFNTILNLWRSGVRTIFNWAMAITGFLLVFWFKTGIIKLFLIAGGLSLGMVVLSLRFPAFSRWTESGSEPRKSGGAPANYINAKTGGNSLFEKLSGLRRRGTDAAECTDQSGYISDCSRAPLPLGFCKVALLVLWLTLILAADLAFMYFRPELMQMGRSFLQIGALTFGSGYAMLPFIQRTAVNHFGWITDRQFAVALALSLITPGPVTIIGVFIGYKVAGLTGAVVGMVNMYFPAWAFTTVVAAPYAKLGQVVPVRKVIGGIVAAFIGTLIVVLIKLSADTLTDIPSIALAGGAFAVQRFTKIDTVWVVLGGALISLFIFR